jgi:hypothetical protein
MMAQPVLAAAPDDQAWEKLRELVRRGALRRGNELFHWWDDRCVAPIFGELSAIDVFTSVRSQPKHDDVGGPGFGHVNPEEVSSADFQIRPADGRRPRDRAHVPWRELDEGQGASVVQLGKDLLVHGNWCSVVLPAAWDYLPMKERLSDALMHRRPRSSWPPPSGIMSAADRAPTAPPRPDIKPHITRFPELFLSLLREGYLPALDADAGHTSPAQDDTTPVMAPVAVAPPAARPLGSAPAGAAAPLPPATLEAAPASPGAARDRASARAPSVEHTPVSWARVLLAALGVAVFVAGVLSAAFAVRAYQKTLEYQDAVLESRAAAAQQPRATEP